MRRFLFPLVILFMVFTLSTPAFAYEWPPPPADIPRTVITADTVSIALSGVKTSLRSITNIGIKIMGIVVVFSLIGSLFDILFFEKLRMREAVRKKQWHRAVDALDRTLNYGEIVGERIEQNKLRRVANAFDRRLNYEAVVQVRVEKMEINHDAKRQFTLKHMDGLVEERILQMEINDEARRRRRVRRAVRRNFEKSAFERETLYLTSGTSDEY